MSKLNLKEIDEEIQKERIEKEKKDKLKALKEGKIIEK
jgi:hypothetical protein